jgi:hypothetical protein
MGRDSDWPVFCAGCRLEIEACAGRHGDWKHTRSNREACTAGGYARPETAQQADGRRNAGRRQKAA